MLMPPAEFRVKRITMGLQPRDIARIHDVNKRSAIAWEKEYYAPHEVQVWLQARWEEFTAMVDDTVSALRAGEEPLVFPNFTPGADADLHLQEIIEQRARCTAYLIVTMGGVSVDVVQARRG